jgi:hypothetical protein
MGKRSRFAGTAPLTTNGFSGGEVARNQTAAVRITPRGLCNDCYRKVQRRGGFNKHPRAKIAPAMREMIRTLRAKVRRRNRPSLASSP